MQKSPWFFLSRMALSIFCAETFVMLLFLVLPKIPDLLETFLDSTLLTILITPSLYFFLYRPLNLQMSEQLLIEKELRNSENHLKQQTQNLEQITQKLQQAPQLLLAEKMSSLGQLVAGIAHEINNPVNFILANLSYLGEYFQALVAINEIYQQRYLQMDAEIQALNQQYDLEFVVNDIPNLLESMQRGARRIHKIVLALRNFSRLDEAEIKSVDIHDGIDSTLLLLQYRLNPQQDNSGIQVIKHYGELPNVECYPDQLNQVFMNILSNAIDILENHSSKDDRIIEIRTHLLHENVVVISIKDNGQGIDEEIQRQLFDPFFTTKEVGKGTGLGLSISYQIIVNTHKGSLKCISAPGKGAEFVIEIPLFIDAKI
ncbi:HAMP domain-containing histidine kinase [Tolypothrix sp. LEGE 11397]|nr:sensor histidine kinase [Tolypothrix sp. PCC 7601]MBE9085390.1 HAMP domain-containing histidine kinase [Tolypothrix sp. LEGE 11397]UYD23858.1 HAMP domain-containing histidine kinase [Tolypothrix sp. PCC 7712]UYD33917.1 HAMP domain-containing histidine kinase [Tolypothrix sp. PCC 7601]